MNSEQRGEGPRRPSPAHNVMACARHQPAAIINPGVRAVFHSGLVQLRISKGLRRRARRARALAKLGGRCERCGQSHPAALEIHHRNGNGKLHAVELDRLGVSLSEWVVREADPRAGRFAVELLCLNCHRIEHASAAA